MACSDPECHIREKSPLCVYGLYAMHRHITFDREPCVRCKDYEIYCVFRLRRRRLWYSLVYLIWPSAFRSPQTDAERMFEVAASISLIGFQLPAYAVGADVGYASAGVVDGNWLS